MKSTKALLEFWEEQMKQSHTSSNYFFRKSPSHYHMMLLIMAYYKQNIPITVEELKTKLFGCMSQRAAANIQDEMEALGPVRLTEVQEAQKQIIAVARRMSDEGSIVLAGRGGDDYV